MNIDMTGEAARELVMESLVVRLSVAIGALRHIAVFAFMAGNAEHVFVFTSAL